MVLYGFDARCTRSVSCKCGLKCRAAEPPWQSGASPVGPPRFASRKTKNSDGPSHGPRARPPGVHDAPATTTPSGAPNLERRRSACSTIRSCARARVNGAARAHKTTPTRMRRPQAAHSPRQRRAAAAGRLRQQAPDHKPVWHSPPSPKRPAAKPAPVYQPYQPPSPPRAAKKDPPPPPTFARISGQHPAPNETMASDTGPDVQDRAFRAALAEALSLARDPRHVVALSRVYAHAVGASDPDDPLAKAALAAADVAVAEDLAAPTPRVVRRASSPSSPYSPVRASSVVVAPVSPPPSIPAVAPVSPPSIPVAPGAARVPSTRTGAGRTPGGPGCRRRSRTPGDRPRRPRRPAWRRASRACRRRTLTQSRNRTSCPATKRTARSCGTGSARRSAASANC